MELDEVCFDLLKRGLRNTIPEAQLQAILRHVFKDDVALQM
jgi:hypothetical protein